ncbi:MAG: GntR family transcriptional regulator [Variibacter sp.]
MNQPYGQPTTEEKQFKTMSAAAAARLRQLILDGQLPGGTPLRQGPIAEYFGISRIPVREALLQLEAEGLAKILPHKGAIVSKISIDSLIELFELRKLLEPYLLRRSVPHLTTSDFANLERILQRYSKDLRENRIDQWGELNSAFHLQLYSRSRSPRLLQFVGTLLQDSDRHIRIQLAFTKNKERAEREHAQLLKLCASRRIEEALELLDSHIENIRVALVGYFEKQKQHSQAAHRVSDTSNDLVKLLTERTSTRRPDAAQE